MGSEMCIRDRSNCARQVPGYNLINYTMPLGLLLTTAPAFDAPNVLNGRMKAATRSSSHCKQQQKHSSQPAVQRFRWATASKPRPQVLSSRRVSEEDFGYVRHQHRCILLVLLIPGVNQTEVGKQQGGAWGGILTLLGRKKINWVLTDKLPPAICRGNPF